MRRDRQYAATAPHTPKRRNNARPRPPPHRLRALARTSARLIGVALVFGCATDRPDPTGLKAGVDASRGLPFVEGLASPLWQQAARDDVSLALFMPVVAGHAYPILSVAQYLAVQEAEAAIG